MSNKRDNMEKIKKYAAALLSVLTATLFCSCGGGTAVRNEVVEAYDIDANGEMLIVELFTKFDGAFTNLAEAEKISSSNLHDYADAIIDVYYDFNQEFENYRKNLKDKLAKEESKGKYMNIFLEDIGLSIGASSLEASRTNYIRRKETSEALFKNTINFINKVSQFFYGKDKLPVPTSTG